MLCTAVAHINAHINKYYPTTGTQLHHDLPFITTPIQFNLLKSNQPITYKFKNYSKTTIVCDVSQHFLYLVSSFHIWQFTCAGNSVEMISTIVSSIQVLCAGIHQGYSVVTIFFQSQIYYFKLQS